VTRRGQAPRRLRRDLRHRRIGGVCAGIAEYLGVDLALVRLTVVGLLFFSFGLVFCAYVAMWIFVPARPEVAIPDVSRPLHRELERIDKLVRRAHRRLPADVGNLIQETFDAFKVLTGELESSTAASAPVRAAWDSARQELPRLIELLLVLRGEGSGVLEDLKSLERTLRRTARDALGEELAAPPAAQADPGHDLERWRRRVDPMRERLRDRVRPQTLAVLQRIEDKLGFLLGREEDAGGPFDIGPFKVRKIAFEYLPQSLENYLRLPSSMAQSVSLSGGITAEELLSEQLIRLDNGLEDLATSLFERDAQGLLVHGRFLRSKFADEPFDIARLDEASEG